MGVEQRGEFWAGDLDLEVICVHMTVVIKWVTSTVHHDHWCGPCDMDGGALQVAHLVLVACQELFSISYAMFVILLVVNSILSKDRAIFTQEPCLKVFQNTQKS